MADSKLEYFKKKILAHLDDLEQKENAEKKELKKSLIAFEMTSIEKAGYPVGTIREWKGKKYIKIAPGKWKPKYDSNSRGAKMAIAALKKRIDACTDSNELLQIILENRSRFSDEQGRPLPFVKELSEYVSNRNDSIEGENEKKVKTEKKKAKKNKGGNGGDEPPKGSEFTDEQKETVADMLNNPTEEMPKVEYTRENYNKLFPKGMVDTPTGKVKLGEHQFERLGEKDKGGRKGYLGALHSTLSEPMAVIEDIDDKGRKAQVFVKSFKKADGKECYMSVVPTIDGMQIVVSNGPRKISGLLNKIKKAAVQFFIASGGFKASSRRESVGGSQTTGTASNLSGVAQQSDSKPVDNSNVSQNDEKSSDISDKIAQWKKEGRKIVKDERRLNFYEGMTADEKIEWIHTEIGKIKEKIKFLQKLKIEDENKSDTDYLYEFYAGKYGLAKPDMNIKNIQKRAEKYVKDCRQADKDFVKNRIKENKDEIKQYRADIDYYAQKTHGESSTDSISQSGKKSSGEATIDNPRLFRPGRYV